MPEIYCVRAEFGRFANVFKEHGYVAIGWFGDTDLSKKTDRDAIHAIYQEHHPDDTSPYVIGQQVSQVSRFLFDLKPGDFLLTPSLDPQEVYWGTLLDESYEFIPSPTDGCPYQHRRKVRWNAEFVSRSRFSVPLQNTMRASLTVFQVKQQASLFEAIGKKELVPESAHVTEGATEAVIDRILQLDAQEFEILVTKILEAIGFEAQHVGRVGDDGVDATGEMDIYNLARVKLYVQAKRYAKHRTISAKTVRALRQNIESGAQGAFITTSDFQKKALAVATERGFPRIGTVNGEQLVDLLAETWDSLDPEFRLKLGLKRSLVAE